MARGILTPKVTNRTPAQAAISFTAADATNNHVFDNTTPDKVLLIKNAHSSDHIVTIKRPATVDGATLGDLTVTVAAGATAVVGPFPTTLYNQADAPNSLTQAVLIDPPATPTALSFALIKVGSL